MGKQYQKGQELLCIKQMALDEESYGIDCYVNLKYKITSEDPEGFYVETESGSEVLLSESEIQEYFKIA